MEINYLVFTQILQMLLYSQPETVFLVFSYIYVYIIYILQNNILIKNYTAE